jgi:hypothetical protein
LEFVEVLRAYKIEVVIDVRHIPRSHANPHLTARLFPTASVPFKSVILTSRNSAGCEVSNPGWVLLAIFSGELFKAMPIMLWPNNSTQVSIG